MGVGPRRIVTAGRIAGLYGVQGWVKVLSYTEPPELLLQSSLWQVCLDGQWQGLMLSAWRRHGKAYIASLESYDVREKSIHLVGADIGLLREQLPTAGPGEYYWADLIGLKVYSTSGELLGVVDHLLETGANDVLVVEGERQRLIPYLCGAVVQEVDLELGVMRVDWDPEF